MEQKDASEGPSLLSQLLVKTAWRDLDGDKSIQLRIQLHLLRNWIFITFLHHLESPLRLSAAPVPFSCGYCTAVGSSCSRARRAGVMKGCFFFLFFLPPSTQLQPT